MMGFLEDHAPNSEEFKYFKKKKEEEEKENEKEKEKEKEN
jgi:hypothetical protein